MKKLALALALLPLTACAPVEPMPGPDRPPMGERCSADRLGSMVGRPATPALVERAKRRAGASMARTLSPGQVVTMEYRVGRLNVHVDERNMVVSFNCG